MQYESLIGVKIGTNSIIKDSSLNLQVMERVGADINRLTELGHHVILITSGGITAGMLAEGNVRTRNESVAEEQRFAAIGWPILVNNWSNYIQSRVTSTLVTAENIRTAKQGAPFFNLASECFKHKDVLLVNNNDSIDSHEIRYTDNDPLASELIALFVKERLFRQAKLLYLTDTEGVYRNYSTQSQELIGLTTVQEAKRHAREVTSRHSSGGMISKINGSELVNSLGVDTVIGKAGDSLQAMLDGKIGTTIR